MRRIVSVLLLMVVFVLAVSGCSSRAKPFLGKWDYDFAESGGFYYIFEEKGVLKSQTHLGESMNKPLLDMGTYKVVDEDTILMTDIFGEEKEYTYTFEKDETKLTISDADYIMSFTKVEEPEN
ncbi:MAG: hypothetical protein EOM59_19340 [Clostridia bacterium]|nr:hypothetical protein [Clostridia bacterium]